VTNDADLDRQLSAAFSFDPSAVLLRALDDRYTAAVEQVRSESPMRRRKARTGRTRRRVIAALAVAAVLVGTAASPPVRNAFDSWFGGDFESVWDVATTVDQSVVDQGYRVTLVRAYADPVGLYLTMTMEDLEGRDLAEAHAGMPSVKDDQGIEYPANMGQFDGTGSSTYAEGLWRYDVPSEAASAGIRHLTAELTAISVRQHDPPDATPGFAYETLWTEVPGSWTFDFDLDFQGLLQARPEVTASHAGIDVVWTDLVVTPAATIITLEVTGLEPTEKDWGWEQGGRIERDGRRLEWFSAQGVLDSGPDTQTLIYEMEQGREDLSGEWTITIDEFRTDIPDPDSNVTTETRIITGPWVLTFDGPPGDTP
jgi:hypothetical protein